MTCSSILYKNYKEDWDRNNLGFSWILSKSQKLHGVMNRKMMMMTIRNINSDYVIKYFFMLYIQHSVVNRFIDPTNKYARFPLSLVHKISYRINSIFPTCHKILVSNICQKCDTRNIISAIKNLALNRRIFAHLLIWFCY